MPLVATRGAASAQGFGEFAQSAAPTYIEDVFSTYLYTGTGANQTFNNGVDLSTKGGMVWIKQRSSPAEDWRCVDSARGITNGLQQNLTNAQQNWTGLGYVTSFNTNGFSIGTNVSINTNAYAYASWTFRKQPKFFDVVTYTGNGSNRTIAHNLGSAPGCIIVKRTDSTSNWQVYHRGLSSAAYVIQLNTTIAEVSSPTIWNSTAPTSTVFSLGTSTTVNASGGTYVAYLFAHDAGGFGLTGLDNVISCGSYTGNALSAGPTITLGYEPQWVLIKRATGSTQNWVLMDTMRGMPVNSNGQTLFPNLSNEENNPGTTGISPTATGFAITNANDLANAAGETYIYIAIRRGPMKTPTSGTSVYTGITRTGTGANATVTGAGFPVDLLLSGSRNAAFGTIDFDRLRGATQRLFTYSTAAEAARSTSLTSFAVQDGYTIGDDATDGGLNNSGQTYIYWNFRRAPGFFDVVCYTGTGSARTVSHNLGVIPELMIVKRRNSSVYGDWYVYTAAQGATKFLLLNLTDAVATNSGPWNNTAPTSSVFTAGSDLSINSTATYVAYLFATVAGVSKVGSYTGTGTTKQIDCGFTGGARFVLIKRTDSTGDWYVWDSARGIVAGSDPYLTLNSTAAEVTTTDWVDTYSAGFELSNAGGNNVNINGAAYIFLSVA